MKLKRTFAILLTLCMMTSLLAVNTFAAGEQNLVSIETYTEVRVDNDGDGVFDKDGDEYITESQLVDYAFEGEILRTVLSIENSDAFTNYDVIISYDNTVVQLLTTEKDAGGNDILVDKDAYRVDFSENNGVKDINQLDLSKTLAILSPYYGLIQYAAMNSNSVQATEKSELLEMNFKVIGKGNPDIKFVNMESDKWPKRMAILKNTAGAGGEKGINLTANPEGIAFVGAEDLITTENLDLANTYLKPADIASPVWEEFGGKWDIPAETDCRGYIVELEKDGNVIWENDGMAINAKDFLSIIKIEGKGSYRFSVEPLGKNTNAEKVWSEVKEVTGIPLLPPSDVTYDPETGLVSWTSNNTEETGYTVEIYEGEVADSSVPVKVFTGITATSQDIKDYITVGDYTIKVKATSNDNLYIDSPYCEEPEIYSTGSTIYGEVKYNTQPGAVVTNNREMTVVLTDSKGGEITETVSNNGEFCFTNVPNETYTVTIKREGIVERTLGTMDEEFNCSDSTITLNKSISKKISKTGGIKVYLGDIVNTPAKNKNVINAADLGEIIALAGSMEGDDGYNDLGDFISNDEQIEGRELALIVANYGATADYYYVDDIDFDLSIE